MVDRRESMWSGVTYRNLLAAQIVALIGTGVLTVALSLLAFDVAPTAAGKIVATALTIKMVAYVVLSPLVAAATSRIPPRRVLVTADVVRFGVALSLPWVDQVWHIYALMFVLQAASATFTPTYQAALPVVLPDEEDYTRALSLSRLAYDLEAVLSPILAAALLTLVSFHNLFVVTAIGFAGSAVLVATAQLRVPARGGATPFWSRASAGARLFARRPALRALLALDLAVAAATALILVTTVVAVRQDLGLGETSVAIALGVFGAGSMVVALCTPIVVRRLGDRTMMLAGGAVVVTALVLAGVATSHGGSWPFVLTAWFVTGAAVAAVLTPGGRVITREVSADDVPAAFTAHFSLSHACFLLTYPLAGWASHRFGVAATSTGAAVLAAAAILAALLLWPRESPYRESRVRSSV